MPNAAPTIKLTPNGGATPLTGDVLANDFNTTAGWPIDLVTLPNGNTVQSYSKVISGTVPMVQIRSTDGAVLATVQVSSSNSAAPRLGVLANGDFVAAYKGLSGGGDLRAQRFSSDGIKLGGEISVTVSTASTGVPAQIATYTDGSFSIVWQAASTSADGASVRLQRYAADGSVAGAQLQVEVAAGGSQTNPQVAVLAADRTLVTWADSSGVGGDASSVAVKGRLIGSNGIPLGNEFLINTTTANAQDGQIVTALIGGGFAVAWIDRLNGVDVRARVFDANGISIGTDFLANTATAGSQINPTITPLKAGGFVLVWQDGSGGVGGAAGDTSGDAIKAQVFDADGSRVGGEILVNTRTWGTQGSPNVEALTGGGFVVGWISGNSLYAQQFGGGGEKAGAEFVVNVALRVGPAGAFRITETQSGGFAVGWLADGVHFRLYDDELAAAARGRVSTSIKGVIAIADADAGSGALTVTVATSFGRIHIDPGSSGVTVASNDTASVTLTGTMAQLSALLGTAGPGSVMLDATGVSAPGTAKLSVSVNDNGNSGGPPQIATASAALNVESLVPPGINLNTASPRYVENSAPIAVLSIATLVDNDSPTLASATVRIAANYQVGQDRLELPAGTANIGNITTSFDVATGTLTLRSAAATASADQFLTALNAVRFSNSSDDPITAPRTLQVVVSDGEVSSTPVDRTVTLTAVADAPIIDLNGEAARFDSALAAKPGGPALALAPAAVVSDPDSAAIGPANLTFSPAANPSSANLLTIADEGSGVGRIDVDGSSVRYSDVTIGSFSGGAGTAPLIISLNAGVGAEAVSAVIRAVRFSTQYDNPGVNATSYQVTLSTGDGLTSTVRTVSIVYDRPAEEFGPARLENRVFGSGANAGDWANERLYPRLSADVNGDGLADVVGFGDTGVFTMLRTAAGGWQPLISATNNQFALRTGYGGFTNNDLYYRTLADVNGDGRADIVGFGQEGVLIGLGQTNGTFAGAFFGSNSFGANLSAGGWSSQLLYPRAMGDVNGDGRADIVGFGDDGVFVSLATGNGYFAEAKLANNNFGRSALGGGWTNNDVYARMVADMNGDRKADLVGFGIAGVWVALSLGDGTFGTPAVVYQGFGTSAAAGSWQSNDRYPRTVADIDGDGDGDIVAFGWEGVYVARNTGNLTFAPAELELRAFGGSPDAGNWSSQNTTPRVFGDLNGDGAMDIIGFAPAGVTVSLAAGLDGLV